MRAFGKRQILLFRKRLVEIDGGEQVVHDETPKNLTQELCEQEENIIASVEDVIAVSEKFLKRNKRIHEELTK
ncbi:MAG: hypothetical protein NC078_10505 [Ruminococcus sp.]|nr:hypothetical protein [Ruminococcus sp.]